MKYILHERNERNFPIKSEERLSLSIDKGVTLYAEKTTNLDRYKDDVTQYKLAHPGDLVMNSMNMIVGASGVSDYFGCVSPAYYVFFDEDKEHETTKYMGYVFQTPRVLSALRRLGKGIMFIDRGHGRINTCRLKVSRYDLFHLPLPLPPASERIEIIAFLQRECNVVDAIISKKKEQLATLAAYKKSLIYEYVTGKKEVPTDE